MKTFVNSWVYPVLISGFLTILCGQTFGWDTYCLPIFFGTFAITSKFFDYSHFRDTIEKIERDIIYVHRDYALRDIVKLETCIQHRSTQADLKAEMQDLENKLLGMFTCCKEEDLNRKKLRDLRGNLGNFRTQLLIPNKNKSAIYSEIAEELKTLRLYLEEL